MFEKLKSFLLDDTLFFSLLIILIALISFQLGRQAEMAEQGAKSIGAVEFMPVDESATEPNDTPNSISVVASRAGAKYHLLDCPGASQMNEENKIFFDSIDLARAAGYEPAGNCPGLTESE